MEKTMNESDFREFPKMARYSRECIVTEKIDGTNAQILIVPTSELSHGDNLPHATVVEDFGVPDSVVMFVGSRTRWITPGKNTDNAGFAEWAKNNFSQLKRLGPGRHFGEWWGSKIQRTYGRTDRVFSLFNVSRWIQNGDWEDTGVHDKETGITVSCCRTVPILVQGQFSSELIERAMNRLRTDGSIAQPGFMQPEGIVIWHCAGNIGFKKTLLHDESPKTLIQNENPKTQE